MKTSQILTLSAALAAAGLLLLNGGPGAGPHARSTTANAPVRTASTATDARASSPAASLPVVPAAGARGTVTAAASPSVPLGGALAPDDGPGGDHLIQAMLDAHSPHNLPTAVEQRLDQLGRAVWLADVTGQGRTRWPIYFTAPGTSGYSSVRIQAAATHATSPERAVVTLIWAATSPSGDPEVGLPGTVLLAQQSNGTWEPTR